MWPQAIREWPSRGPSSRSIVGRREHASLWLKARSWSRRGHSEKVLHAGDQLSTHRSMEAVPIKQEIAWSRNAADHLKMMQDMVAFKESLQKVRMPGIRYSSRFLDSVPANAVVFLSVPNARDAIEDAQTLFTSELRRTGAEGADTKFTDFVGRISRFSEYLGEEFVVAGVPNGRKMTAVAIASVHRSGLRQFLETEMSKIGRDKGAGQRGSGADPGPAARGTARLDPR